MGGGYLVFAVCKNSELSGGCQRINDIFSQQQEFDLLFDKKLTLRHLYAKIIVGDARFCVSTGRIPTLIS